MEKQEFINMIAPIIKDENEQRGFPLFNSVVIAQACLETGFGLSKTMLHYNAIFGIKATKIWKGKVYSAKTGECFDGKNITYITDYFRAYETLRDGIKDYFDLLTTSSYYRKAIHSDTAVECIEAIHQGGYATDPAYSNKIINIIKNYNLKQYDYIESNICFLIGSVYTLQTALNVRDGAGTNFRIKKYEELSEDGKLHAYKRTNAVLKKGTRVTCKDVIEENGNIWLKIPSGFVAAIHDGNIYIK